MNQEKTLAGVVTSQTNNEASFSEEVENNVSNSTLSVKERIELFEKGTKQEPDLNTECKLASLNVISNSSDSSITAKIDEAGADFSVSCSSLVFDDGKDIEDEFNAVCEANGIEYNRPYSLDQLEAASNTSSNPKIDNTKEMQKEEEDKELGDKPKPLPRNGMLEKDNIRNVAPPSPRTAENHRLSIIQDIAPPKLPHSSFQLNGEKCDEQEAIRSMPVKYLFLDEIDAYPGDSGGEGDPVLLSIARTNTFARRKIFLVSTPTIHGISRIEKEFEATDKRYFFVPCPYCNYYQVLKWSQIKWEDKNPNTAHYICTECSGKIENHQKTEMLDRGEWRPTNRVKGEKKGFHLSSLYSPVGWYSWTQAVEDFLHAKESEQLLKVWINTTLGETWVDKGEVPDWKQLFNRREFFQIGTVPKGEVVLTAGVDVQKDRLEVEVVAWGKSRESWSIDYQVFEGDTGGGEVWGKLSELLNHHFIGENGLEYMISMMAVDAGYATQEVYNWVRGHQGSGRVMAVKGVNKALVPLSSPSRVDITVGGQKLKRGIKLWPVGVSILKSELFQLLNVLKEGEEAPAGYCHFPEYAPEYFKQLTAEQLVSKVVKGYTKQEWQKIRERNEVLDCRVYARAASIALGIDRWPESKWENLADKKAKRVKKVRRSQWLNEK